MQRAKRLGEGTMMSSLRKYAQNDQAREHSPLIDEDRGRTLDTSIDIFDDDSDANKVKYQGGIAHCMSPLQCLFYTLSSFLWATGVILTCTSRAFLFIGRRIVSRLACVMLLVRILCLSKAGVKAFSMHTERLKGVDIWAFGEGAACDEIRLGIGCSLLLFRIDTLAMLTNVRRKSTKVVGIAVQTASITHTGYCPGKEQLVGKISCSGDVKPNPMSVPQLMANGCTVVGKGHRLDILEPSRKVLFKGKLNERGLFVCPLSSIGDNVTGPIEAHPNDIDKPVRTGSEKEMEVLEGFKGVPNKNGERKIPAPIDRNRKSKILYDHDGDNDLSKMHGHITQEERKRATAAWNLHEIWGHPGKKVMGDTLENGLIAGCTLTRKDLDNAFKMLGLCFACLEGGYNFVVLAMDQESRAMFQMPIKQKTASREEGALQKIIRSLNRHGHKVSRIVFDSESVFLGMQDRISVVGVECGCTPAGLHNKPVEGAMQTLKLKMRTIRACLDYELPKHLYCEPMAAEVSAINATPNTRSDAMASPSQLVAGDRPAVKHFKFGQVDLCEFKGQGEDDVSEWAMYLGTSGNVDGHHRAYILTRGLVYSRRSFKSPTRRTTASASAPKEWGFAPRIVNRNRRGEKDQMSE